MYQGALDALHPFMSFDVHLRDFLIPLHSLKVLRLSFFLDVFGSNDVRSLMPPFQWLTLSMADSSPIKNPSQSKGWMSFNGEGGIRTLDRVAPIQHFQCCAFDHSATSPVAEVRM